MDITKKQLIDFKSPSKFDTSVLVFTYNHKKFINQCLENILSQVVESPVNVLIYDDQSTDGTIEVIQNYVKKYPELISAFIQPENKYKKHFFRQREKYFEMVNSKYLAVCEGDDYWIDPNKLQLQYEFMENNPDCNLCFHPVYYTKPGSEEIDKIVGPAKKTMNRIQYFSIKEILKKRGDFVPTNSMFFRSNHFKERPLWVDDAPVWDFPLTIYLAAKSKVGFINIPMGVYRVISSPTSWTENMKNKDFRKKHYQGQIRMLQRFNKWSNYKYIFVVFRAEFHYAYIYWKNSIKISLVRFLKKITEKIT